MTLLLDMQAQYEAVRSELELADVIKSGEYAYENLGYKVGDFPVSERLTSETLSLPIYPEMTSLRVESVSSAVVRLSNRGSSE